MDDTTMELNALQRIPFFAELEREDLEGILAIGEEVSFDAGQAIVERGDPGDALYILTGGAAQVDVGGRYHDLKPGEFFGEMGVIAGRKRMATVKAVEPVRAVRIAADRFQSFALEHPRVALSMLRSLVDRLREVQERVEAWAGAW